VIGEPTPARSRQHPRERPKVYSSSAFSFTHREQPSHFRSTVAGITRRWVCVFASAAPEPFLLLLSSLAGVSDAWPVSTPVSDQPGVGVSKNENKRLHESITMKRELTMSRIAIQDLGAVKALDSNAMRSTTGGGSRLTCFRLGHRRVCIRIPILVRKPFPFPIPLPGPLGL
jgi:hypothetical protein